MPKKLRNLGVIGFQTNTIHWNDKEVFQIGRIKKDFAFQDSYDLHGHLAQLSTIIQSLVVVEDQTPTHKDMHNYLDAFKRKMTKMPAHIEAINNSLSKINELQCFLESMGTSISSFIANKNLAYYAELNILRDAAYFFDFNNIPGLYFKLEILKRSSEKINTMIEKAEKVLPKIKKGAPNRPFLKNIIQLLMKIYRDGTQEEPRCGHVGELGEFDEKGDIHGKYVGKFYNFLIAVEPLIRSKLNIFKATPNTLGKYTCEILTDLKKSP